MKQKREAREINKEPGVTYLFLLFLDPVQRQSQASSAFLQAGKEECTGIMSFATKKFFKEAEKINSEWHHAYFLSQIQYGHVLMPEAEEVLA